MSTIEGALQDGVQSNEMKDPWYGLGQSPRPCPLLCGTIEAIKHDAQGSFPPD